MDSISIEIQLIANKYFILKHRLGEFFFGYEKNIFINYSNQT